MPPGKKRAGAIRLKAKARAKNASARALAPNGNAKGAHPQRVRAILAKLDEAYPAATCALRHENPFQLLVSTILSAQCTDERVNKVTPALFKKLPTPEAFAYVNPGELQQDIRSTGFFRNKTKSIIGASKRIVEEFGGQVPRTMEEMLTLPGVARKTANVVLGTATELPRASSWIPTCSASGGGSICRATPTLRKLNRIWSRLFRRTNGFCSRTS